MTSASPHLDIHEQLRKELHGRRWRGFTAGALMTIAALTLAIAFGARGLTLPETVDPIWAIAIALVIIANLSNAYVQLRTGLDAHRKLKDLGAEQA